MKTIYLVSFLLTCFLSFSSAQNFTDDIYFTPADASKDASKVKVRPDKPRYKNGAKEIIFKDSSQGKTVVLDQDTVYFLSEMNDSIAMAETTDTDQEEGYYLDGFEGGEMEYEYAERIRRFHNPKFSIHISDPQYMDIYFLDDSKWNVYIDGSYAWVTPTWTNPYWYNYYWAPYSYSSWYWRTNPYAYHSWYYSNPWTYGLYGWTGYSPWYYGYYDWGYPYYGGYYGYYGHYYGGWGYPYYHHPYYWGSYTTVSRNKNYSEPVRRRAISGGSSGASSVSTNTRISGGSYSPVVGRSTVVSNERSSGGTSTGTRPTELRSTVKSTSNVSTARSAAINTRISGVDTRTRTVTTSGNINRGSSTIVPTVKQTQTRSTSGTVSSPTRSTRTVTTPTRSSTTVRAGTGGSSTLRSTVTTPGSSSSSSTSTYTPSVRSSSSSNRSTYSAPTRSSSSSSSSSYSAPSRSSSSSSSSSYSAPSRSSSSSSSGSSSRSSGGGSRR